MKILAASLIATGLLCTPLATDAHCGNHGDPGHTHAHPRTVQIDAPAAETPAATPLGEEAETDIEIINGVPVNPALKARLLETTEPLSVQEMLELSEKVLSEQQEQLDNQKNADKSWMQGDPLGHLEGEMKGLVQDIDAGDTADRTQAKGEDVVRKMDTLIEMLEQASSACSSCSGSGSGSGQGNQQANGNQPAQDSTLAAGPGGSGDLNAAGEGNNRFEDLDPEQRDAILRAQEEQQGLPPEFNALLADYYQRLASEEALENARPDRADNTGNATTDTPTGAADNE